MKKIPEELECDKDGLWYIDGNRISINQIYLQHATYTYTPTSKFFTLESTKDYIVKIDESLKYFKEIRIKSLLRKLYMIKEQLPFVDLPIAYYKEDNEVKGMIVPYYKDSYSLRKASKNLNLESLKVIYHHDEDYVNNLISLYLEILDLLWKMYNKNVSYLDIHGGNFVIYDNSVKVIDFDPRYLSFNTSMMKFNKIIKRFSDLVNNTNHCFGINDMSIVPTDSFESMQDKVKSLEKTIRR